MIFMFMNNADLSTALQDFHNFEPSAFIADVNVVRQPNPVLNIIGIADIKFSHDSVFINDYELTDNDFVSESDSCPGTPIDSELEDLSDNDDTNA